MFSAAVRVVKGFAAEQKLRQLKKDFLCLKLWKKRLPKKSNPYKIIKKPINNMNSLPSAKYKQTPNDIEKKSIKLKSNPAKI